MTRRKSSTPPWETPFLDAIRAGQTAVSAATQAGIARSTPYARRMYSRSFEKKWQAAQAAASTKALAARPNSARKPGTRPAAPGQRRKWQKPFLVALAETSNVSCAALRAGTKPHQAYALRRTDARFAALWMDALMEGYAHLEMEVLGYLREPEPDRKMDVTAALRLLAAHRDTVARQRALQDEEDEDAVLESLDQWIEDMKQRRLANEAIIEAANAEAGRDGAR